MVMGFGGFTSEIPGEYETEVARYCAQLFLEESGRIRKQALPKRPAFSRARRSAYLKELKKGLGAVEGRLVHMIADSHVDILGAVPAGALRFFIEGKLAGLAKEKGERWSCELRLQVPTKDFEFDGEGWADQDLGPVRVDDALHLITFAEYAVGERHPWSGSHVLIKKKALRVDRDRKGLLPDKEFCTIQLPTKPMLEKSRKLPYPVFVARIKLTDEGTHVGSDRWQLVDEIQGLEGTILT
jgi:hypothetical protein